MHILAADDDPVTLRLVHHALTAAGYEVDMVTDGEDAWERLQHSPPAVLLTDWMMPRMDGPALIRKVRSAAFPHYVYIILLTARSSGEDAADGLELGADDFITKPFTPRELVARVALAERFTLLRDRAPWSDRQAHDAGRADIPAAAVIAPPDGPPLDESVIEQLRELDQEGAGGFLEQIVALFVNETPRMLDDVDTAARGGDATTLRLAAHSLKASSQGVGASRLAALAKELEEIGRAGATAGAAARVDAIRQEYRRVESALRGLEGLAQAA